MTTRREFLVRGGALVFACTPLARRRARDTAPATVRLVFVDDGSADARDGVTLGVEEARHAAELFGGGVEWTSIASAGKVSAELRRTKALAVIGGTGVEAASALARAAAAAGAVYMNTLVSGDALRAVCASLAFHVAPSDRMLRDARALAHAPDAAPAEAWDPSLVRFGADTLNNRFRARFGRPMTAAAWTNWFAVKALWESTLRVQSAKARALADHLAADATQFDGHKGRPLSFRSWDHQLRQPVYVRVAAGRPPLEEPVQGPDEDARASLDKIGAESKLEECRHG
ncbi:MAG TPA: hypothetical protein VHB25_03950 [Gemmatimonadaceae bacterium]|nr:hypothetical protein [Gemmatimonadaceae bacterium]